MAAKVCYITPCDLLDTGTKIVASNKYGLACEVAKLCHFAEYYLAHNESINNWNPDGTNPVDETTDPVMQGKYQYLISFADYKCHLIDNTTIVCDLVVEVQTLE